MNSARFSWVVFALIVSTGAQAAGHEALGLPDSAVVEQVLNAAPRVKAADARLRVESARSDGLASGPYEWNANLSAQRRRADATNGGTDRFNEWSAGVERTVRLPGKAAMDRALGQGGVDMATIAREDAFHEASRDLLTAWFAWLRGVAVAEQWQSQVDSLNTQARAVARRNELGDASSLDAVQANAALAQARAELATALAMRDAAAESLSRRYPDLPLTAPTHLAEPGVVAGQESEWMDALMGHSHGLRLAQSRSHLAGLNARRVGRDRVPDPTFGVFFSRERGGEEQVIGAQVSIPIVGGARRASASAAVAEADAVAQMEADALREATAEAATSLLKAKASRTAWEASRTAGEQMMAAAQMTERAYRLGEGSFDELLLAQRRANEAALSARQRHLDALESYYRLSLDAGRLWGDADMPAHPDMKGDHS
ncbi:TolC family protein [Nitrogeniibacter aestuarii]|uniref:TolC family protein n=1 Tax=Nitrogeniibacter aestuarii TaxID=2815343 RepID=UPI001D0F9CF9|nr:TolC family protein [Nitrogeniibacter aestuarii]